MLCAIENLLIMNDAVLLAKHVPRINEGNKNLGAKKTPGTPSFFDVHAECGNVTERFFDQSGGAAA